MKLDAATPEQVDMLRHSLGLDSRHKKPYRNHYCAELDDPDCVKLVELGLFEPIRTGIPMGGLVVWRVTEAGQLLAKQSATRKPRARKKNG